MTFWLYAVALQQASLETGQGAGGGAILALAGRGLHLLYESCAQVPEPSRDTVIAYGDVVQRLCATREALPFRYGASVPSESEAVSLLEQRADDWTRQLFAIRGHSEFIVHVTARAEETSAKARTGAGYLAERAEELRRTRTLEASLSAFLAPSCRRIRPLGASSRAVRLACLTPMRSLQELQQRVADWAQTHPGEEAPRVTGPWPPFSFVEREEDVRP